MSSGDLPGTFSKLSPFFARFSIPPFPFISKTVKIRNENFNHHLSLGLPGSEGFCHLSKEGPA
ncbi:Hypothetical protein Minf_2440 [Methylacidiphilum infernorum V4]|uniref:Uncharacterized protein n=1 Tax=Methylacidiphilum infernorum (isolate V4) TaxID=481448 RepID=B3E117_METI4|nr:Hypothetical protein Minf_2440 [Methylacidiphilum infernorum V4]